MTALVVGAMGSALLTNTANAAVVEAPVTAAVVVDCGAAQNFVVQIQNAGSDTVEVLIDVDSDLDGAPDFGDGVLAEPNASTELGFGYRADGDYGVRIYSTGIDILNETVVVDCEPEAETPAYFVTSYDGTVWQVSASAIVPLSFEEWQELGFPSPTAAPTDYVRYAWSPSISAVTFFGPDPSRWVWKHLTLGEWTRAGNPGPRLAGWIEGSTYYQWASSDQIFVQDVGGVKHALTYEEWAASDFRPFDRRADQGFVKLSWDNNIAFLTDFSAGAGAPIDYARWSNEGFPNPSVQARFPGDQVYRQYGDATIWYAGPTVNRPISLAEWTAMGRPAPDVRGIPPRPADKDCGNFGSQAEAQAEFNFYFPAYGDVYGLDGDGDGIACESYFD
ncbi:excalibur calcium-binding domain-containing protein [Microbacterium sp. CCNWLW134]|uniref:excalibur calcium-binding domain-containing protein n=1 Tax=Microbacterium sp. CCNWLW134 TaxID=3122064 RepID=UPI00300FD1FF